MLTCCSPLQVVFTFLLATKIGIALDHVKTPAKMTRGGEMHCVQCSLQCCQVQCCAVQPAVLSGAVCCAAQPTLHSMQSVYRSSTTWLHLSEPGSVDAECVVCPLAAHQWLLVVCNDYGQIIAYQGTQSTSLEEAAPLLREIAKTCAVCTMLQL